MGTLAAGAVGLALLAQIMALARTSRTAVARASPTLQPRASRRPTRSRQSPQPLFNDYLLAFELTSIVLLVAIVGAVVLGKQADAAA